MKKKVILIVCTTILPMWSTVSMCSNSNLEATCPESSTQLEAFNRLSAQLHKIIVQGGNSGTYSVIQLFAKLIDELPNQSLQPNSPSTEAISPRLELEYEIKSRNSLDEIEKLKLELKERDSRIAVLEEEVQFLQLQCASSEDKFVKKSKQDEQFNQDGDVAEKLERLQILEKFIIQLCENLDLSKELGDEGEPTLQFIRMIDELKKHSETLSKSCGLDAPISLMDFVSNVIPSIIDELKKHSETLSKSCGLDAPISLMDFVSNVIPSIIDELKKHSETLSKSCGLDAPISLMDFVSNIIPSIIDELSVSYEQNKRDHEYQVSLKATNQEYALCLDQANAEIERLRNKNNLHEQSIAELDMHNKQLVRICEARTEKVIELEEKNKALDSAIKELECIKIIHQSPIQKENQQNSESDESPDHFNALMKQLNHLTKLMVTNSPKKVRLDFLHQSISEEEQIDPDGSLDLIVVDTLDKTNPDVISQGLIFLEEGLGRIVYDKEELPICMHTIDAYLPRELRNNINNLKEVEYYTRNIKGFSAVNLINQGLILFRIGGVDKESIQKITGYLVGLINSCMSDLKYRIDSTKPGGGVNLLSQYSELKKHPQFAGYGESIVDSLLFGAGIIENYNLQSQHLVEINRQLDSFQQKNEALEAELLEVRPCLNELRDKNNQLRGENNQLRGKNEELCGENNQLRGENEELLSEYKTLLGENEELLAQYNILRGENKILRGENDELRGENKILREQHDDLPSNSFDADFSDYEAGGHVVESLADQLAESQAVVDLRQKLADNEQQVVALKQKHEQQLADLRQKLADNDQQVVDLRQKLADNEQQVVALKVQHEQQVVALKQQVADNERQLADLRKQLADNEQQLVALKQKHEQQVADNEQQLPDLRKQLADNEQQVVALKVQHEQQVVALRQKLADNEQQLADLRQKLADNEQQLADLRQKLADNEQQVVALRQQHEQQVVDLRQQVAEKDRELADLRQQVAEKDRELADLRKQHEQQVAEKDQQVVALRQQLADNEQQVAEKDQQVVALRQQHEQQVVALRQQVADNEQQVVDLRQQVAEKDRELADLRQQVAEKDRELADLRKQHEQQVAEKDQQVVALRQQLADNEQQVAEKDQQLAALRQQHEQQVVALRQQVADNEQQLVALKQKHEQQVAEKDQQLAALRQQHEQQLAALRVQKTENLQLHDALIDTTHQKEILHNQLNLLRKEFDALKSKTFIERDTQTADTSIKGVEIQVSPQMLAKEVQTAFESQNQGVQTAFESQNQEVQTAFESQNQEVQTAFESQNQEVQTAFESQNQEVQTAFESQNQEVQTAFESQNQEVQTGSPHQMSDQEVQTGSPHQMSDQEVQTAFESQNQEVQTAFESQNQEVQTGSPHQMSDQEVQTESVTELIYFDINSRFVDNSMKTSDGDHYHQDICSDHVLIHYDPHQRQKIHKNYWKLFNAQQKIDSQPYMSVNLHANPEIVNEKNLPEFKIRESKVDVISDEYNNHIPHVCENDHSMYYEGVEVFPDNTGAYNVIDIINFIDSASHLSDYAVVLKTDKIEEITLLKSDNQDSERDIKFRFNLPNQSLRLFRLDDNRFGIIINKAQKTKSRYRMVMMPHENNHGNKDKKRK
ncbi:hypothetical protein [Candidatus Gromoviella agglomerans]|uniref:hypothetical protein n=1 Tax=Candidatus Gromoviella agglomerans TaxID=2806609 RepID=UPI001E336EC3|nr:hypothetical protein [Candidatus Gromoviella agglomerans]UFX98317.1 Chromosome segregation ATPase domain protein [Candidatus Gromoviella agglomerans]